MTRRQLGSWRRKGRIDSTTHKRRSSRSCKKTRGREEGGGKRKSIKSHFVITNLQMPSSWPEKPLTTFKCLVYPVKEKYKASKKATLIVSSAVLYPTHRELNLTTLAVIVYKIRKILLIQNIFYLPFSLSIPFSSHHQYQQSRQPTQRAGYSLT